MKITFADTVSLDWRQSLRGLLLDTVASAGNEFGGHELTAHVKPYPGGALINGKRFEPGQCLKVSVTNSLGQEASTYLVGTDGHYWYIDQVVLQPQVALPKQRRSRSGL
ncbi:MAG: hypothetical protein RLZZ70_610 [Candidatus Parcubacteria bacterium]|jgi:hypothetical protein